MIATAASGWVAAEDRGLSPEDRSRAGAYALLSSLFYAPPSPSLLHAIREADLIDASLEDARLCARWRAVQDAARSADPPIVRQEYDDAFVGVGCAPVLLYASYYLSGTLIDAPLIALRQDLARLGLARKPMSFETEDHIAALCDVMRFLIVGDAATPPADMGVQRAFFMRHIAPCYAPLCEAVTRAEVAGTFYRKLGAFTQAYFDLEVESFSY
jgi:TorA maturation chaperone TorD